MSKTWNAIKSFWSQNQSPNSTGIQPGSVVNGVYTPYKYNQSPNSTGTGDWASTMETTPQPSMANQSPNSTGIKPGYVDAEGVYTPYAANQSPNSTGGGNWQAVIESEPTPSLANQSPNSKGAGEGKMIDGVWVPAEYLAAANQSTVSNMFPPEVVATAMMKKAAEPVYRTRDIAPTRNYAAPQPVYVPSPDQSAIDEARWRRRVLASRG